MSACQFFGSKKGGDRPRKGIDPSGDRLSNGRLAAIALCAKRRP
ncbi:hypothetical protein [Oxynema aestuarii]|nr:hypothetical protein [Oxynema aestuarii]